MHNSSFEEMKKFVEKYLDTKKNLKIIDIGSMDVNGTYKDLFNCENWEYIGLDLEEGRNVDLVADSLYSWGGEDESFDVVISGQCLEHVKNTHLWIKEVARIVKKGGIVCIIAPWSFTEHRFPVDCWRILPDGMRFLLEEIAGLEVIDVYHNAPLMDCIGIAKKYRHIDE